MNKSLLISAIASNQGKTVLTTALLYYFKKSVRPFKVGPDYIDPQFHEIICQTPSVNLDSFIMEDEQVQWIYQKYSNKDISILEGVMGFYDGTDKGCSAYTMSKLLNIPTILLLDGSGSYTTVSAVLMGLKTYKEDNTMKAVVLNKLSSAMHYALIKNQIEKDFDDIIVLGYIGKNLESLSSTHLGLELKNAKEEVLEKLSNQVLEHIDMTKLLEVAQCLTPFELNENYPFETILKSNKKVALVKDQNFSFVYHDNIEVLQEIFEEVVLVDSTKDECIPADCHAVFIPGGYVETKDAYSKIEQSHNFRNSLIEHSQSKHIYAECAGLLYLGNKVDDYNMSGILDVNFELKDKRSRLGYYYANNDTKGHSFHYTKPVDAPIGLHQLSKKIGGKAEFGSWKTRKVMGTYLHTMFRNNLHIVKEYFGI